MTFAISGARQFCRYTAGGEVAMSRHWDEKLCFDEAAIDSQHRTILEQYDTLALAVQEGNSTVIIDRLTRFLEHYTGEHFEAEELVMFKYRYPQRAAHREEHVLFEHAVEELKATIRQEGVTRNVAVAATGVLYRYIVNHVNKADMELAQFIRRQKPVPDEDADVQPDTA